MNVIMPLLLLLVLPLIIIKTISVWERDIYHSNSWWGFLGWSVGAFTSGIVFMPLLWIFPFLAMMLYLIYTPLWGFATAKIINGIAIKTSWNPEAFGRVLVGIIVGLFVATSLINLESFLTQDLKSPPMQLCIFIVGTAAGFGAGIMSRPCNTGSYD